MSGIADWTRLPLEVLARIIDGADERGRRFLDARYRFAAAHVCHQWRLCVTNPSMSDALMLIKQDPLVPTHLVERFIQSADRLDDIVPRDGVPKGSPLDILFYRVHDSWSLAWGWFEARLLNVSLIVEACPFHQLLCPGDDLRTRAEYIQLQMQKWSPWIKCTPASTAAIAAAVLVATMHPQDIAGSYAHIVDTLIEADTWSTDWFAPSGRARTSAAIGRNTDSMPHLEESPAKPPWHTTNVGSPAWYAQMHKRTGEATDNLGRVLCRTAPVDAIFSLLVRRGISNGPFFVNCMRDAAVRNRADVADVLVQILQDHPLADHGDSESTDTWEHQVMRAALCVAAVAGSRDVLLRFCDTDRRQAHPCVRWNADAHRQVSWFCDGPSSDTDMIPPRFDQYAWHDETETERWEVVAGAYAPLETIQSMVSTQASFSRIAVMAGAVLAGRADVITVVYESRTGNDWATAALYAAVSASSNKWLPKQPMWHLFARGLACLDGLGGAGDPFPVRATTEDIATMCASLRHSSAHADMAACLMAQWPHGVATRKELADSLARLITYAFIPGEHTRWPVLQHLMLALEAHAAAIGDDDDKGSGDGNNTGDVSRPDQSEPTIVDLWAIVCARKEETLVHDPDTDRICLQNAHPRAVCTLVGLYVLACLAGVAAPPPLPLSVGDRERFLVAADVDLSIQHKTDSGDDDDDVWAQAQEMVRLPPVDPKLADPVVWRRWCAPSPILVRRTDQWTAGVHAQYKRNITPAYRLAVAIAIDALENAGLVILSDLLSNEGN